MCYSNLFLANTHNYILEIASLLDEPLNSNAVPGLKDYGTDKSYVPESIIFSEPSCELPVLEEIEQSMDLSDFNDSKEVQDYVPELIQETGNILVPFYR